MDTTTEKNNATIANATDRSIVHAAAPFVAPPVFVQSMAGRSIVHAAAPVAPPVFVQSMVGQSFGPGVGHSIEYKVEGGENDDGGVWGDGGGEMKGRQSHQRQYHPHHPHDQQKRQQHLHRQQQHPTTAGGVVGARTEGGGYDHTTGLDEDYAWGWNDRHRDIIKTIESHGGGERNANYQRLAELQEEFVAAATRLAQVVVSQHRETTAELRGRAGGGSHGDLDVLRERGLLVSENMVVYMTGSHGVFTGSASALAWELGVDPASTDHSTTLDTDLMAAGKRVGHNTVCTRHVLDTVPEVPAGMPALQTVIEHMGWKVVAVALPGPTEDDDDDGSDAARVERWQVGLERTARELSLPPIVEGLPHGAASGAFDLLGDAVCHILEVSWPSERPTERRSEPDGRDQYNAASHPLVAATHTTPYPLSPSWARLLLPSDDPLGFICSPTFTAPEDDSSIMSLFPSAGAATRAASYGEGKDGSRGVPFALPAAARRLLF